MLTEAFVLLAKLGKEYKWTALPRVISTGAINLFTILPSSFEAPTTISLLADTASQPMSQMKISFFHLAEKAGLQLEVIEELMQDYAEERLHFVSWPNRVNEMIREAAANRNLYLFCLSTVSYLSFLCNL